MPARLLRHDTLEVMAAATWTRIFAAVIPAARAAVGRLVVSCSSATVPVTFHLSQGAAVSGAGSFANSITLSPGETFEQVIVVPAGKSPNIYIQTGGANAASVAFFGEEVDN